MNKLFKHFSLLSCRGQSDAGSLRDLGQVIISASFVCIIWLLNGFSQKRWEKQLGNVGKMFGIWSVVHRCWEWLPAVIVIWQPLNFGYYVCQEWKENWTEKGLTNIYYPAFRFFSNNSHFVSSAVEHFSKWRYLGPKLCPLVAEDMFLWLEPSSSTSPASGYQTGSCFTFVYTDKCFLV